jgi:hypothetical protein
MARFARGSEKRRQASFGVELRGDKDEWRAWAVYGDYRVTMRDVTRACDRHGWLSGVGN